MPSHARPVTPGARLWDHGLRPPGGHADHLRGTRGLRPPDSLAEVRLIGYSDDEVATIRAAAREVR